MFVQAVGGAPSRMQGVRRFLGSRGMATSDAPDRLDLWTTSVDDRGDRYDPCNGVTTTTGAAQGSGRCGMAGGEHRRYSFAEEVEVAEAVGALAAEFATYRPGEPQARIVSRDGQRGAELSPPLAEALDVIGYLMSKGHAVVIEAVLGLLSVAETADLVRKSPEQVRSAVRDGIIPVRAEDGGRISITRALLSRNTFTRVVAWASIRSLTPTTRDQTISDRAITTRRRGCVTTSSRRIDHVSCSTPHPRGRERREICCRVRPSAMRSGRSGAREPSARRIART